MLVSGHAGLWYGMPRFLGREAIAARRLADGLPRPDTPFCEMRWQTVGNSS